MSNEPIVQVSDTTKTPQYSNAGYPLFFI